MPIKHAALKQLRKDRKRQVRNNAVRSELKTVAKQFLGLISSNRLDDARKVLQTLEQRYDRAASRNVIHRNTASRLKSRMALRLNKRSGT